VSKRDSKVEVSLSISCIAPIHNREVTMGNKLTGVLLFLSFVFVSQFSWGQIPYTLGTNSGPQQDGKSACIEPGVWNGATSSCNYKGTNCSFRQENDASFNEYKLCVQKVDCEALNASWVDGKCNYMCDPKLRSNCGGAIASTKKCSDYSNPAEHSDNSSPTGKAIHCVCKIKDPVKATEYPLESTSDIDAQNICAKSEPKIEVTAAVSTDEVLPCLQDIKTEINACKAKATETVEFCDKNSEENGTIRRPVGNVIDQATGLLHARAASKGIVEDCRNIGLMSAAAGYGVGKIQGNCKDKINSCKQTCTKEILEYSDVEKISAACIASGKQGFEANNKAKLESQAAALAAIVEASKDECAGSGTTAERLLGEAQEATNQFMKANASAVACEQALASGPPSAVLTMNCITDPGSAGCPVNCATNSTSPQCKCLNNPSDPTCKGGPGISNMAGTANPSSQYVPIGGLSAGAGASKFGGGSGGDLGGLDIEASEKSALEKPRDDGSKDAGPFGAAVQANTSGGSGGGGSGSGAAEKNAAGAAAEEKSFLGGTFAALKNAANNIFGGSGSGSKNKSATAKEDALAKNNLKPNNSAIRGLASNGKSCFVDAKGSEYCFGRRNMDIFKMMNSQYSNQYNTLIMDK
jgi:hypothetical protein